MPDAHKNFSYSTVATAPSPAASGTSLVVASGDGAKFPAVPFNATIWPSTGRPLTTNAEIVRVTNIATDTFTIVRTQESTSARTVVVGDQIAATMTAKVFEDSEQAVEISITQASHGLAVGDVVRHNGTSYTKAQADSGANAEVVGIVSVVVTTGIFRMITGGKISGLSGLTAGTVYFLSASTAGALTATEPTTIGNVSKPLLIADSTSSGYFLNMRGMLISGDENSAIDGWTAASDTWTYATSTTFTVSGDQTAKFSKGTRIKLTQTTVKYFVVAGASFSSGTTTVTIAGGSDYSLANAAITNPYYSYAANPQGYPGWFSYTPTLKAVTSDPTLGSGSSVGGSYSVNGNTVSVRVSFVFGSSGAAAGSGEYYVAAPVGTISVISWRFVGSGFFFQAGTGRVGVCDLDASTERCYFWVDSQTARVSNSTPAAWSNNHQLHADFSYENN